MARELAIENGKLKNDLDANGNSVKNLATPVQDGDAATKKYVDENGGAAVVGKLPVKPLPKYLHALAFDDTYPADAEWLYEQLSAGDFGLCSAVRRGGKLFRNYDWTFDDAAEFAVKVSGNASRFASVGMASVGSRLTENDVMSGVYSRYYRCLPGMTLDGINEKGVVAEINVDGGPKDNWHGTGANALHILAAVRWVLDHGTSAAHAAAYIAENIKQPTGDMNFHFMIADATATYIVENGAAHLLGASDPKVLTNYALYGTGGGGMERYELLAGGEDIKDAWFTNAYQSGNGWHSDFESEAQHASAILQWAEQGEDREAHRSKTTSGGKAWWQSVHTTEYDFAAKTMKVAVQEQDEWFTFAVDAKLTEVSWSDVTNKPTAFPPEDHTHVKSEITDFPTAMPPTAHSHATDSWFTTAIETVKTWATNAFAALTHSHATDDWFTTAIGSVESWVSGNFCRINDIQNPSESAESMHPADAKATYEALSGKIDKSGGTATDLSVVEPLTIEASMGGNSAVLSVGSIDGVLYISGVSDLNVDSASRTLNEIDDKLNELDDGKSNITDFAPADPADYVKDFVQKYATNLAAAFSTTKTYAVDELVTYSGDLYRCTTAVTTAGAWDATKWTAVAATDSDTAFLKDAQGHLVIKETAGQKNTLYIDAYRMVSLTAAGTKALKDASVNDCGTIAANDVLTLPPAFSGYCRDLIVILQTPATLPTFTFPLASTDLEPWSDQLPTWAASTIYRITMSETRSGKWEIHAASKGVTA